MRLTVTKILYSLFLSSSFLMGDVVQAQSEQNFIINEQGTLTAEDKVLENGRYLDVYEIETKPDEDLVILLGSDAFDSYLLVFDAQWEKVAENDDFQGTYSGLLLENPQGGLYYVVATSQAARSFGDYYLTVRLATANESKNVAANRLFETGFTDFDQGTAIAFRSAQEKWEEAAQLFRETGNTGMVASALNSLGVVHDALGEKDLALTYYGQALALRQEVGDRSGEALTLNNLGYTYSSLGRKTEALDHYQRALGIAQELGDRRQEGSMLNNIGAIHGALGNQEEALKYYEQSLPILQETNNRNGEARTLLNVGSIYNVLGKKETALTYYQRAIPIFDEVNDPAGKSSLLNNIAAVYDDTGETQLALDNYEASLEFSRTAGDRLREARTIVNIGSIYDRLGERERAVEYYLQALPILQEIGDRSGEATTLSNIGLTFSDAGNNEQAVDYYEQAIPIFQAAGDRRGEAITLGNIGLIYAAQRNPDKARNYYEQALTLLEAVGDRSGQGTILTNIGRIHADAGEFEQAFERYQQALTLKEQVGDHSGAALALYNIAAIQKNQGQLTEALPSIQAAIAIVEDLRTKVASPELRQTFFSTVQDYYQLHIEILMELQKQNPAKDYDQQAFGVSEKSRARTLLELLTEANTNIKEGIAPELLQQEQILLAQLNEIEAQRAEIYNDQNSTNEEKIAIDQTLKTLTLDYQKFKDEMRRSSPKYAALKYPEPLDAKQLQSQILDEDTVLLQYAFGEQKSYLWAITKDSFSSYELPSRSELNRAINDVRQQITSVRENLPEPAQIRQDKIRLTAITKLSELILAPATEHLDKKRILVVADGNLHYLPFSILNLAGTEYQPLGDRHEIINLPSASTLDVLRQNPIEPINPDASLAMIADPIFQAADCRLHPNYPACPEPETPVKELASLSENSLDALALQRATRGFNDVNWDRLPGTRTEAQGILSLLPQNQQTLQAFDFDASRDLLLGDRLKNYDLIHIATHGFLNTEEPELSGLVLSLLDKNEQPKNGFVRLNDIFNLKLDADLIVLSACQTGLGEEVKGEGLVGLSRGFMYAGVPRIVMSLWQVDDAATAEFMTRFYRLLLQEKLTPAAALQATQREMRTETQWTHPYYWAAFILQGEWD